MADIELMLGQIIGEMNGMKAAIATLEKNTMERFDQMGVYQNQDNEKKQRECDAHGSRIEKIEEDVREIKGDIRAVKIAGGLVSTLIAAYEGVKAYFA